jgi:hypothetical protein
MALGLVSWIGLKRYKNSRRRVDQNAEKRQKSKFIYQELTEKNEVAYPVVLTNRATRLVLKIVKIVSRTAFKEVRGFSELA